MFDDCSGRLARSIEEAETYIWRFIAENHLSGDPHVLNHSRGFDLYLPWLSEIVGYRRPEDCGEALSMLDLDRLYMDAAWDMVMRGYLRPGPANSSGSAPGDSYGKGYSLTLLGVERLNEVASRMDLARSEA